MSHHRIEAEEDEEEEEEGEHVLADASTSLGVQYKEHLAAATPFIVPFPISFSLTVPVSLTIPISLPVSVPALTPIVSLLLLPSSTHPARPVLLTPTSVEPSHNSAFLLTAIKESFLASFHKFPTSNPSVADTMSAYASSDSSLVQGPVRAPCTCCVG